MPISNLESTNRTTLVIGASLKEYRYSNICVRKLLEHGIPVFAIGQKEGYIENIPVQKNLPQLQKVHTITLYLNAVNQVPYYDYILQSQPSRVIFNPGAENEELKGMLQKAGIETLENCTIMMLEWGSF